MVKGPEGRLLFLGMGEEIRSLKDSPVHPDFRLNVEMALDRGDPVILYGIVEEKPRPRRRITIGTMLWFPTFRRAGIVIWSDFRDEADWTDAANPLDALERYFAGEMTE